MSFSRSLVLGFSVIAVVAALLFVTPAFDSQAASLAGPAGAGTDISLPAARVDALSPAKRLVAVMSLSSLDLREVNPGPGEEVIVDVFVTMGRARVRIPDHWVVNTSALPLIGSIQAERRGTAGPVGGEPPRLVLRGLILAGKLEVTS